jgi:hypothetical protein
MSQSGVCFIGGARYSPLDATSEKKLRLLKALGELFVIGFSKNLRPRQCNEHAHFYLMPNLPIPLLRYVEVFVLGPLIISWVIFRHGVQVLVNKAPTKVWLVSWPRRSRPQSEEVYGVRYSGCRTRSGREFCHYRSQLWNRVQIAVGFYPGVGGADKE